MAPAVTGSWRAGKASAAQRGYGSRWRVARAAWLRAHPLCVMCTAEGCVTAASVVDHIRPHHGDPAAFWDRTNWQSLCKAHHDGAKAAMERASGERSGSWRA